ncbi:MAG: PAS domain S-box protein [Bacteroidetes bacterium]|nr:MAG: PAS domain S-box protein [Bacteroidota bacterium]
MTKNDIEQLLSECLLCSKNYSLVITDLEGRYRYVNEVFKNRFTFMNIDFIGQPFWITIHPEDVEKCNLASYQCITNPKETFGVQVRKPDNLAGDFYWTEWEFSLFKDHNKNPIGILCLGHDITETEKTSKQAKEFAQKVETIIEEITDGFYVLNREWKFIKINKTAEQILGIPREKLLGRKIWDIFPHTPDYNYPAQFRKAMNEYVTVSFEDYRADLDRWFSAVCYASKEGLTVFFKEITQTKKQIEKITQQEYMLRAIYQSTTEASTFIDRDFIIRYNNQVAKDITKQVFGREAQIGEKSLDYFLPEYQEEFRNFYEKVLFGESFVLERADGTNWWQISLFPVYDKQQNIIGIANNVQDITDRKNKEQKLMQQNSTLRQIAWQQSHELRRPVANILGLCDLLKNYENEEEEMKNKYITYMLEATSELDKIIHKIVLQANESEYLGNE